MLEVTFSMIIVKDITLKPVDGSACIKGAPLVFTDTVGTADSIATKAIKGMELSADMVQAGINIAKAEMNLGEAMAELFTTV